MYKLLYVLLLAVTSVTASATNGDEAPPRYKVQGIVYDENGESLPGASVVVVGTTLGAGTNSDGEFDIAVKENKTVDSTTKCNFSGQK